MQPLVQPLVDRLAHLLVRPSATDGGAPAETINGTAIGAAGTGAFAGYVLAGGGDATTMANNWWHPSLNPTGRYASQVGFLGRRVVDVGFDRQYHLDPYFRGPRSQNAAPLGTAPLAASGGYLQQIVRAPVSGEMVYLPTTGSAPGTDGNGVGLSAPSLVSTQMCSDPFLLLNGTGDFIVKFKCRMPDGKVAGMWFSPYISPPKWPDNQEIDHPESVKSNASGSTQTVTLTNEIGSDTDGGGAGTTASYNENTAYRWYEHTIIKSGGKLDFYRDNTTPGAQPGAGADLIFTTTVRNARIRSAHAIRFQAAVNNTQMFSTGSTFDPSDFLVPVSLDTEYWQVWIPAAGVPNAATISAGSNVLTTAGSSISGSLPSKVALWGTTPDVEEAYAGFYSVDDPGTTLIPANIPASRLPIGMTVDLTARTWAWTVPATEGGRTLLRLFASYNVGGCCKRAQLLFDVAPVVQSTLFANTSIPHSGTLNIAVAYADFHSGNLGHTYTATSDKAWAVVTYDAGNTSFRILGTAPAGDDTATITINAVNGSGQTTTVTRTIASAAVSWSPSLWGTMTASWIPNDGTAYQTSTGSTPATANADPIGRLEDSKGAHNAIQASAGNRPTIQTANSRKVAKFTAVNGQRYAVVDATAPALVTGNFSMVFGFRRGTPGVSTRMFSAHAATGASLFNIALATTNGVVIALPGGTGTSATALLPADDWHVLSMGYNATTGALWARLDRTLIINTTITATPLVPGALIIGAYKTGTSTTTGYFDGMQDTVWMSSDDTATYDLLQAELYLQTLLGSP